MVCNNKYSKSISGMTQNSCFLFVTAVENACAHMEYGKAVPCSPRIFYNME